MSDAQGRLVNEMHACKRHLQEMYACKPLVWKQSSSSLFCHLMASCEGATSSPSHEMRPGRYYKDVHISGSAIVQVGDVINPGGFSADCGTKLNKRCRFRQARGK